MALLHDVRVTLGGPGLKEQIEALDHAIAGMELAINTTPDLGSEEKNVAAVRDLNEARAERATLQALLDTVEKAPAN